jgi:hypothetical protein
MFRSSKNEKEEKNNKNITFLSTLLKVEKLPVCEPFTSTKCDEVTYTKCEEVKA